MRYSKRALVCRGKPIFAKWITGKRIFTCRNPGSDAFLNAIQWQRFSGATMKNIYRTVWPMCILTIVLLFYYQKNYFTEASFVHTIRAVSTYNRAASKFLVPSLNNHLVHPQMILTFKVHFRRAIGKYHRLEIFKRPNKDNHIVLYSRPICLTLCSRWRHKRRLKFAIINNQTYNSFIFNFRSKSILIAENYWA